MAWTTASPPHPVRSWCGLHPLHPAICRRGPRHQRQFVTVYPADEEQLHTVLRELGSLLEGFEGPYILTDLRWHDGPLYVRYGAFARMYVVDGGWLVRRCATARARWCRTGGRRPSRCRSG